MTDPRVTDAVRKIPELFKLIEAMNLELTKVREDNAYMKEQLRAIKKTVTRKYDKKDEILEDSSF